MYTKEELFVLMRDYRKEHWQEGGFLIIQDVADWAIETGRVTLSKAESVEKLQDALIDFLWCLRHEIALQDGVFVPKPMKGSSPD